MVDAGGAWPPCRLDDGRLESGEEGGSGRRDTDARPVVGTDGATLTGGSGGGGGSGRLLHLHLHLHLTRTLPRHASFFMLCLMWRRRRREKARAEGMGGEGMPLGWLWRKWRAIWGFLQADSARGHGAAKQTVPTAQARCSFSAARGLTKTRFCASLRKDESL